MEIIIGIIVFSAVIYIIGLAWFLRVLTGGNDRRDESRRNQKLRAKAQKGFTDY